MCTFKRLTLFLLCNALASCAFGQKTFTNCTAAFLDNKLVVNEYSPEGTCTLDSTAHGTLTVCPATYNNDVWTANAPAAFMVAIRDKNTGTLCMMSNKTYKKIEISQVMSKSQKGDHIVLLTLDNELALPHNEILIQ